jgi:DNA invertase Pin-like site-specific DNA recombinase
MSGEYVIYLRLSKGGARIPEQRKRITGHILRIGGTVTGEFIDYDSTAFQKAAADAPPRRDDFRAMLEHLAANPGRGIGAYHADRLMRNMTDTESLIRVCTRGACPIVTSGGGSYDLTTADGRNHFRHAGLAATHEVDHNAERIRDSKAERAAAGEWLGGRRPFGYTRDGMHLCHRELAVTAAEADRRGIGPSGTVMTRQGERLLIRLPYDEAGELAAAIAKPLAGVSLSAIARDWNSRDVRTASGARWDTTAVRTVLLNPRNAGLATRYGEITGPALWPAVADELTWRKMRTILTDPSRRTTPGPARRWLGSGLYLCGVCQVPVSIGTTGSYGRSGGPRSWPVYRCQDGHVARDAVNLDAWVGSVISDLIARPGILAALRETGPDTRALELELAGIRDDLDELARQAGARQIDVRQMGITSRGLLERAGQIEQAISGASRAAVLAVLTAGSGPAVWDEMTLDGQRALLEALVTVTVLPSPKGRTPGWRRGEPYFSTEWIRIEPRYEVPGS